MRRCYDAGRITNHVHVHEGAVAGCNGSPWTLEGPQHDFCTFSGPMPPGSVVLYQAIRPNGAAGGRQQTLLTPDPNEAVSFGFSVQSQLGYVLPYAATSAETITVPIP